MLLSLRVNTHKTENMLQLRGSTTAQLGLVQKVTESGDRKEQGVVNSPSDVRTMGSDLSLYIRSPYTHYKRKGPECIGISPRYGRL